MTYRDFLTDGVEAALGVEIRMGELFPDLIPLDVPPWLVDAIERGRQATPIWGEKARSECLVSPILVGCREFVSGDLSIYSGQRLDVDPALGLVGECDFLLAMTPVLPMLKAPIVAVIAMAKDCDIEDSFGRCIAQTVAAQTYNERAGKTVQSVFGCVTKGDGWQFLRLDGTMITIDRTLHFITGIGGILAALCECVMTGKSASARMAD